MMTMCCGKNCPKKDWSSVEHRTNARRFSYRNPTLNSKVGRSLPRDIKGKKNYTSINVDKTRVS